MQVKVEDLSRGTVEAGMDKVEFEDKGIREPSQPKQGDEGERLSCISNKASFGVLAVIGPLLCYSALSLIFFGRHITSGNFYNPGADPFAYTWLLNWWPYAIAHFINPFTTDYIWNPSGFNLMWAQSVPTLAILGAPITLLFGAEATWSALSLASPVLNSYAAYWLIRYVTNDSIASLLSALIFGFSPYVIGAMLGHLGLTFVALIPVLVLLALRRANRDIGRATFIASFGLCAALQFGVSSEVLVTAAVIGAAAFSAFYSSHRDIVDMKGLFFDILRAGVVAIVIAAPGLWYTYQGKATAPRFLYPPQMFSSDVLAFIVPTPLIKLGGEHFQYIASHFTGNYSEEGAYIGIPLIIALACSLIIKRHWVKPAGIALACAAVASMGPFLWINGTRTPIPLPWWITKDIPFVQHALPSRISVYTSLIVATLIGMWLARRNRFTPLKYALVVLGVVSILPDRAFYGFAEAHTPEWFKAALPKIQTSGSVVVLPYGAAGNSMLWQMQLGMPFKMAGGYVGFTPPRFWSFPAIMYLYGENLPRPMDQFTTDMAQFCGANNVTKIVITPGTNPKLVDQLKMLHWPTEDLGDVSVISVPDPNEP
jgi:hypothetical protein